MIGAKRGDRVNARATENIPSDDLLKIITMDVAMDGVYFCDSS